MKLRGRIATGIDPNWTSSGVGSIVLILKAERQIPITDPSSPEQVLVKVLHSSPMAKGEGAQFWMPLKALKFFPRKWETLLKLKYDTQTL